MEISREGPDDPTIYELKGGPFDKSTIRLAVDIFEMPPLRITLEWFPDRGRGGPKEDYVLASTQDDSEMFYKHENIIGKQEEPTR